MEVMMTKKDSEVKEKKEILEEEVIKIPSEEVSLADKKAEEFKDLAQRIQAEFDNYRKRNNEAVRISRNDGINDLVVELLPVIDNFERGLDSICEENSRTGVELIYKQMLGILQKYDVEEIKAKGEEFNPNFHHAIAQEEDEQNTNKVVEVFVKGYKRKDKVLRPAMVKVAQ
jgi:molecular chaperone GrpE